MRVTFVLSACLMLSVTALAEADDWPQWRGLNQDGISVEADLAPSWPDDGPPVLWRLSLDSGFSGIVVADGIAYTMNASETDGEFVLAIDAKTGETLWKVRSGEYFENEYGNGPRATPAVDGGRLYALGATGTLLCLDAKTGEKHWAQNLVEKFEAENAEYGASASPVVAGDKLIVVVGKAEGKSLACLDKASGDVVWTALDDRPGYSTPLVTEVGGVPMVAVLTAEAIVGVGLEDGQEYWRFPWETTMDANVATPIGHDGKLFISSRNSTGSALYQLSLDSGRPAAELLWESRDMKNYLSTCVLVDGYLYGFNATRFTCVDFETGERQWVARGFNKGSLIAAGDRLIILGERGNLALAEIDPEEYRQISEFQLFDAQTWTVPTLANGRLYARCEKELVCLDVSK